MGPAPRVSVLLPVRNGATTLSEAVASVLEQSLDDLELVVVDDGSDDGTGAILEAWRRRDERIRIARNPRPGLVRALNLGLALCRGWAVARMDADDRSHPDRLRRQLAWLEEHPETWLVSCEVRAFPESGVLGGMRRYLEWQNRLHDHEAIAREIFVESPFVHPSVMVRRRCLEIAGGYRELGWAEDYDLWLRLYRLGARFHRLPQVLVEWRERPDRLTRTDPRYSKHAFTAARAHHLLRGPLVGRDAVFVWGAGPTGRRLARRLQEEAGAVRAFVDIHPDAWRRRPCGLPVLAPEALGEAWRSYARPVLLAAVAARGAREAIRAHLAGRGWREGVDWWAVA